MLRKFLLSATFVVALGLSQAQAETNLLVIVDGSNSMWGQIDGTAKVETARETLGKLVSDLPSETKLGLMAYGHTREGDCDDVEILSAIGKDKPEMITTLVHTIKPVGKTPIANALKKSKDAFTGLEGQNNHILLVSDGIESCSGDPCAVAQELADSGLNVSANVIGFGVSAEEGKQLTCIAENTGGKYFDAANADAFNKAIEEVTVMAAAEPEPKPDPVLETAFEDSFDGTALNPHWEVINEDKNSYIVDEGKLMIIMAGQQVMPVNKEGFPNIFQALENMPAGDWTIEATVDMEMHTARDKAYIGVIDDQENWLAIGLEAKQENGTSYALAYMEKMEGGKSSRSEKSILELGGYMNFEAVEEKFNNEIGSVSIKLTKKGRDYSGTFTYKMGDKEQTIVLEDIKMLRPKSQLFIALGQTENGGYGRDDEALESYLNVDSVKVTAEKAE